MRTSSATALVVVALVSIGTLLSRPASARLSRTPSPSPRALSDSEELKRLHDEDQADRAREPIDWQVVEPRDRARLNRVKDIIAKDGLHTANDYYRSAMVLQHSQVPDDFLLAHELCVVAIVKGKTDAAWLAAASEDRFLMNIERPQRFGTQFRSQGTGPMRLYTVGDGVTDELRRAMGVPSLSEARAHEAELNKK